MLISSDPASDVLTWATTNTGGAPRADYSPRNQFPRRICFGGSDFPGSVSSNNYWATLQRRAGILASTLHRGFVIIAIEFKGDANGHDHRSDFRSRNDNQNAAGELNPQCDFQSEGNYGATEPVPAGLRVGVVGGGCSGFSYSMSFENASGMMDKVFDMDGLKVYVDATSLMYLNNCIVDYVETLEGAGFKFENPNVKSTCGCGSSFSV